ncbi:DUF2617 family protein [Paludisphaera soli]|uniref:DUF2617 family protein n=1 Tax=Paludisphaera soli TaxID=2712865 RepID=UPI001F0D4C17|nr:DUF2617 family protein [Paludisphaera soli]
MADRSFQVFHRALHPEWFAVRAHERLEAGPWQADVRIVEGGHAVVFGHEGVRLTEVLGVRGNALPLEGLLLNSPIRHERSTVLRPGGRIVYQVCLEVEQVDPEVFRHLCEETTLDASRGRLFHAFPAANRMSPRPLSQIRVERLAGGLSLQTFHSFPEELAIFRSQSLIEVTPAD